MEIVIQKIQVDEGGSDEDKIRYDVAGTEVAVQDVGGMAFTTNCWNSTTSPDTSCYLY